MTIYIPLNPKSYFVIAGTVKTHLTSRKRELAKLEAAFRDPVLPSQQGLVIYRLSGSDDAHPRREEHLAQSHKDLTFVFECPEEEGARRGAALHPADHPLPPAWAGLPRRGTFSTCSSTRPGTASSQARTVTPRTRVTALWLLARYLEEQGKVGEPLGRCEEFLAAIADIGPRDEA